MIRGNRGTCRSRLLTSQSMTWFPWRITAQRLRESSPDVAEVIEARMRLVADW